MKRAALLLSALLALSACDDKKTKTATTPETTTGSTTDTGSNTATTTTADITKLGAVPAGYTLVKPLTDKPVREFKAEPAMSLQDGKDYYALIDTNRGQFLADLYEQETRVTVNNFVTLARNHYFDDIRFHRVIEGFMAQTGDPKSVDESKKAEWGTGGPGYSFADEFRTKLTFDTPGILAMANSGPATNGSQFFITFTPTPQLNGVHTVFGKLVKGDDLLPKLTRTMDQGNAEIPNAVADRILTVRILTKG